MKLARTHWARLAYSLIAASWVSARSTKALASAGVGRAWGAAAAGPQASRAMAALAAKNIDFIGIPKRFLARVSRGACAGCNASKTFIVKRGRAIDDAPEPRIHHRKIRARRASCRWAAGRIRRDRLRPGVGGSEG